MFKPNPKEFCSSKATLNIFTSIMTLCAKRSLIDAMYLSTRESPSGLAVTVIMPSSGLAIALEPEGELGLFCKSPLAVFKLELDAVFKWLPLSPCPIWPSFKMALTPSMMEFQGLMLKTWETDTLPAPELLGALGETDEPRPDALLDPETPLSEMPALTDLIPAGKDTEKVRVS